MDNNFRLTGPFAEELMKEIESKILTRGYTSEELADTAKPLEYDIAFDKFPIDDMIKKLSIMDYNNIQEEKNIKGSIKKFIKGLMLKSNRWLLIPIIKQQNVYNKIFSIAINGIQDELALLREQVKNIN